MSMVIDHSTMASCMAGSVLRSRAPGDASASPQLSVLATTHLRGSTTNPTVSSVRLTI